MPTFWALLLPLFVPLSLLVIALLMIASLSTRIRHRPLGVIGSTLNLNRVLKAWLGFVCVICVPMSIILTAFDARGMSWMDFGLLCLGIPGAFAVYWAWRIGAAVVLSRAMLSAYSKGLYITDPQASQRLLADFSTLQQLYSYLLSGQERARAVLAGVVGHHQ